MSIKVPPLMYLSPEATQRLKDSEALLDRFDEEIERFALLGRDVTEMRKQSQEQRRLRQRLLDVYGADKNVG